MEMSNDALTYYESIGQVSQLMLTAARQGDWDTLVDAEKCCAALIQRLQNMDEPDDALGPVGRKRKQQIIRRILAEDAEIRNLAQPWLRQLESHLGHARRARDVQATYR
jgi:flagellar protein FliT